MTSGSATMPTVLDSGDLLFASVEPYIHELEEQIRSTKSSQQHMNSEIEIMSQLMHQMNEHEESVDMISYQGKLHDVKRRMSNVSSVLDSVHDRLSRLQRQIAREAYKKRQMITERPIPDAPQN